MKSLKVSHAPFEWAYRELLEHLWDDCSSPHLILGDRTGTGRVTHTGKQIVANMEDGFPILESKKVWFKGALVETLWMLNGRTDLEYLHEHNVHYWDEWVLKDPLLTDFGPIYGEQIRNHSGVDETYCPGYIDQWEQCVTSIKENPNSRRHIITTWNPHQISAMALPPCHGLVIQFIPRGKTLDLVMYQRSCDIFLGLPFNLCNYGIMLHIMAMLTDKVPGKMTFQFGDLHLYANHKDAAEQYLDQFDARTMAYHEGTTTPVPTIEVAKKDKVEELTVADITLRGYAHAPHIPAPVAV